jgi:hypothetical protein
MRRREIVSDLHALLTKSKTVIAGVIWKPPVDLLQILFSYIGSS